MTINDGFDILKSRFPHHPTNKLKSMYGTSTNEQNIILNKLYNLCFFMQVIEKSTLLPFQIGFIISIHSLRGLFVNLGYSCILPCKCNQHILVKLSRV